jgi:hypothetical protein
VVFCAYAGILPDSLQFVYWKTRQYTQVLGPFQRFHVWLQEGRQLQTEPWAGLGLQCALIAAVLIVLKLFLRWYAARFRMEAAGHLPQRCSKY